MSKEYQMVRLEKTTWNALKAIQANWQDHLDDQWASKLAEGAHCKIDLNAVVMELIRREYSHRMRSIDQAKRMAFEDWIKPKSQQQDLPGQGKLYE